MNGDSGESNNEVSKNKHKPTSDPSVTSSKSKKHDSPTKNTEDRVEEEFVPPKSKKKREKHDKSESAKSVSKHAKHEAVDPDHATEALDGPLEVVHHPKKEKRPKSEKQVESVAGHSPREGVAAGVASGAWNLISKLNFFSKKPNKVLVSPRKHAEVGPKKIDYKNEDLDTSEDTELETSKEDRNVEEEDEKLANLLKETAFTDNQNLPSASHVTDIGAEFMKSVASAVDVKLPVPKPHPLPRMPTYQDVFLTSEPFSDSHLPTEDPNQMTVPPLMKAFSSMTSNEALKSRSPPKLHDSDHTDHEESDHVDDHVDGKNSNDISNPKNSKDKDASEKSDVTETVLDESPLLKKAVLGSSELGQYFYERVQGRDAINTTELAEGRAKEIARQNKKKMKEEAEKQEVTKMKWTREDGRFKYKGEVTRIPIGDEEKDKYEIVKFARNAWTGVRFYWVPDGKGTLRTITGEVIYTGFWKRGMRSGQGEGDFEANGADGVYGGDWKNGKPHGQGKFLAKRFNYEGGWKEGKRHGFGEYIKERLQYTGDWINDKKHGYGIAVYADGTRYEGEFEADSRSGFGVCRYPDGSIYTGQWSENQRQGTGTSIYPNGSRYVGLWYKDMKQGMGTLYGALDRKLYEGNWWRNKRHGEGTGYFIETGDKYVGEWFLGKQHGEGDWFGADGSSYKGNYVDGYRHGIGLAVYASGDRYVGEWVRGKREGTLSAYIYKDYGKFVGPFVNDRICGTGEYHTFSNRIVTGEFEETTIEDEVGRYVGLTLNGKKYGRGIQNYKNGDRYDGEFRDGMRAGYGVMLYEDGGKYIGFWSKDQRFKLGTYSLPSGEKYIGRWNKDKRNGVGTLVFENNDRIVDVLWVDDLPSDGNGVFVYANNSTYRGPLKDGLPEGRGSLTLPISVLLKERTEYRKKIGLQYFLKGEKNPKKEHVDLSQGEKESETKPAELDLKSYVNAKPDTMSAKNVLEFDHETITFWREFRRGKMLDGPGFSIWDGNRYEGDFVGFERSGVGKMIRITGETYFGTWKHDREWGIGEVRTRSQDFFVGHWYNGFRNGTGYQSYEDGGEFHGKWMNDRRHGIGLFFWPDNQTYVREYYKGNIISKRQTNDTQWVKKQLAEWKTGELLDLIRGLPYRFPAWSENGLPDYYQQSLSMTLPPVDSDVGLEIPNREI